MYTNYVVTPQRSESLLLALRAAYRLGSREYRARLGTFGLTTRQATVLITIRRHPGEGIRFVSEQIDADLATCSVLVTKLEARGLVRRDVDPSDRRRTRLYVTESAEEVMAAVAQARRDADARIADALGEDAEPLRALLAGLVNRLREPAPAATRK